MTVKELIKELELLPPEKKVMKMDFGIELVEVTHTYTSYLPGKAVLVIS